MDKNEEQFENFIVSIKLDDSPDHSHRDKLEEKLLSAFDQTSQLKKSSSMTWGSVIHSKITKPAAAAVIIVAVLLSVFVLNESTTPAYAVEQTIDAIKDIKTVYMAGEFYRQGEFECWMKFDGDPDLPTHVWLGKSGSPLCKICSPDGIFGLNRFSNRVHFAKRDERDKDWIIKFGSFFKEAVRKAGETDSVDIYKETYPDTSKEFIMVHIRTTKREQKFLVDPDTKLPVYFLTVREDALMEMIHKTLAVKNLGCIRYNEQPPEGIFDLPKDAVVVTNEHDVIVHPGIGMPVNGLTPEQACIKIIKDATKAMNDLDWATVKKLYFPFIIPPEEIQEKLKLDRDIPLIELQKIDQPYQKGDYWFVHCISKEANGKVKDGEIPIKFYKFDGQSYCIIAFED